MAGRLAYRQLRAPRADGELFVDPPWDESERAIEQNLLIAARRNVSLGGRSIDELACAAREHLWQVALQHTQAQAPIDWHPPKSPPERIYLVGHQPRLFHPGVWLKNFMLDQLAKRDGSAAAIHVLIDNDVVADVTLPVLAGTPETLRIERVALDQPEEPTPWEERKILDAAMFANAGDRIAETVSPFVENPIARGLWSNVDPHQIAGASLGDSLARLRHRLELQWGLRTLETPLSAICNSATFRWFLAYVLSRLPQLHQSHNGVLAEYRRLHKLRSRSHPVPDLACVGRQFETPFWVWETGDPRRRKLFAESTGDSMLLSDGENLSLPLPAPSRDDFAPLARELERLEGTGVKIRPRALMTTMYLRVFVGDYFIHGIGGAKYDQITDCLIEDLLGMVPPAYMIASGTKLLPALRPELTELDVGNLRRRLRDLEFHPERFVPTTLPVAETRRVASLVAEKRGLTGPASEIDARGRHQSLGRINRELRQYVSSQRDALLRQISQGELDLRSGKLLRGREFPFCIYPESALRGWLLDAGENAS